MSINLHLSDRASNGAQTFGLFHTPTHVTERILKEPTKVARLRAYLAWVEGEVKIGPGQMLDHKVDLLMWLVEHPTAQFSGL